MDNKPHRIESMLELFADTDQDTADADLFTPFHFRGDKYSYATNRHIAARVKGRYGKEINRPTLQNALGIIFTMPDNLEYHAVTNISRSYIHWIPVNFLHVQIAAQYYEAIASLPNARMAIVGDMQDSKVPEEYKKRYPLEHRVHFMFDGGDGVVMPMRRGKD